MSKNKEKDKNFKEKDKNFKEKDKNFKEKDKNFKNKRFMCLKKLRRKTKI
jgi:hypothetical protein